jgi:hypothetical protein
MSPRRDGSEAPDWAKVRHLESRAQQLRDGIQFLRQEALTSGVRAEIAEAHREALDCERMARLEAAK